METLRNLGEEIFCLEVIIHPLKDSGNTESGEALFYVWCQEKERKGEKERERERKREREGNQNFLFDEQTLISKVNKCEFKMF